MNNIQSRMTVFRNETNPVEFLARDEQTTAKRKTVRLFVVVALVHIDN